MPSPAAISASGIGSLPERRASSTITRTPYSALVENIIVVFPTCQLGYQGPFSVQPFDVMGQRLRGELFEPEQHTLTAATVHQQHRRRAFEGRPAVARRGDPV